MLEASPKNEHSPMRLLAKYISVHAQNEQPLPHLGSTLKCSANVEPTPVVEHTTVHRSDDSGTEGEDRACVPNMDVLNHKLYGRANEHHQLMQAYQTATWRALVLITGDKGSGKTSLAYSLKERVRGDFGYMVSGTWESFARDPFKPFLDLCNNFINQVCDGGEEAVASIRGIMQDLVREEGSITFDLYPGLRRVIGDEDASESGRCCRLSARFCPTRAFRTFMRAFGVSKPVVIVFDNLDSADQCALDLINKIAPSATNNGCLIVCTCRSGLASSSIVSQMLRQLESDNVEINSIHVPNLKTESVNEMLSDILRVPEDKCQSLAKIVVEKTLGNAAYAISWIRALVKGEQLHHDERNQVWLWEKEAIEISMTYPHACALFSRTMDEHPQQLKELLKVASCLGTQLDNRILSVALSVQDVHHYLEMGVDRGALLFDDVANGFAFIHSGARDGAYDLIKEEDRKEFHLAIGRKLWKGLTQEELQLHMFLVVNQLKFGKGLVKYNEKLALAALCLQAGERSMMTADFQSASQVLSLGLQCLGPDSFREDYNLSLTLHNVAAEAFYACGDVVALETTVDAVVGNARTFRDKVRAYSTKILSLGSRDKAHEAIQVGLCVLEQLGEPMPMRPGSIVVEFKKIQRMLRSKTDEMLLRLPEMSVVDKTSSMHILNLMFLNAYLWETTLSVHISLRMVRLSLQYGLSAVSSFGFATYGMLLCGASKDLDAGFRFGQLAIKIIEKFGARSWVPRVYAIVYGCLHSFKLPIRDSLAPLKEAYTIGIGTGKFHRVCHHTSNLCLI
jgi:histidine kinase